MLSHSCSAHTSYHQLIAGYLGLCFPPSRSMAVFTQCLDTDIFFTQMNLSLNSRDRKSCPSLIRTLLSSSVAEESYIHLAVHSPCSPSNRNSTAWPSTGALSNRTPQIHPCLGLESFFYVVKNLYWKLVFPKLQYLQGPWNRDKKQKLEHRKQGTKLDNYFRDKTQHI